MSETATAWWPESLRDDPRGCWADTERLADMPGACKSLDTDALGLCAFHRVKLFGEPACA